jgi:hypothetical protein
MREPMRKVTVWFHSDAVILGCDCGERIWCIDTPDGWMFADVSPGPFYELSDAIKYASSLYPGHPDVARALGRDQWALSDLKSPR